MRYIPAMEYKSSLKIMNHDFMPQHRCTSKTLYMLSHKRPYIVGFCLYEVSINGQSVRDRKQICGCQGLGMGWGLAAKSHKETSGDGANVLKLGLWGCTAV